MFDCAVSYHFAGHGLLPLVAVRRLMGLESERNFHGPKPAALTLPDPTKIQPAPQDRLRIRIVAFALILASQGSDINAKLFSRRLIRIQPNCSTNPLSRGARSFVIAEPAFAFLQTLVSTKHQISPTSTKSRQDPSPSSALCPTCPQVLD